MTSILPLAVLAMALSDPVSTPDPAFPPHAVGGGTVVAALEVADGSVKRVTLLTGQEPFAGCAQQALSSWRFAQAAEPERVVVVVHFRQPNPTSQGSSQRRVPAASGKGAAAGPYPLSISEPSYPPHGAGQGSVVLGVGLTSSGGIDKITTLKPLGVFADASIQAVRQWRFAPASDASGKAVSSKAYVVIVFRPPVL